MKQIYPIYLFRKEIIFNQNYPTVSNANLHFYLYPDRLMLKGDDFTVRDRGNYEEMEFKLISRQYLNRLDALNKAGISNSNS